MLARKVWAYHERERAFCRLWNAELPSTWNWPFASAVTGGAVAPSEPVKACKFPLVAEAAAVEEAALAAAVAVAVAASLAAAAAVAVAATFVADASPAAAAAVAAEPVPTTVLPWSSTSATAAKSVVMPNTALKASAWAPVFAVWVSAAACAFAHVSFAVWSAPHVFVSVSHTNCVMISMLSAEPWL